VFELALDIRVTAEHQNIEDGGSKRHENSRRETEKRCGLLPRANLMSIKKIQRDLVLVPNSLDIFVSGLC
jgi:hypothetical protein